MDIKSCAWCGSEIDEDNLKELEYDYSIICICGVAGPDESQPESAIREWNRLQKYISLGSKACAENFRQKQRQEK